MIVSTKQETIADAIKRLRRLTLSFPVGYRNKFAFMTVIITMRPVRLVA